MNDSPTIIPYSDLVQRIKELEAYAKQLEQQLADYGSQRDRVSERPEILRQTHKPSGTNHT